jgi:uncharacterized BrkB/YihY/UPF0761 family membrane protein
LLAGQISWRRLFVAGLATAVCCTGLGAYITYVASTSIVSNEARYGPIGTAMTLLTTEIGLGVALQLGAAIGATAARGQDRISGRSGGRLRKRLKELRVRRKGHRRAAAPTTTLGRVT